mgnify:CR=1 FL=1
MITFIEKNHIKSKQTSENYSGKNNFSNPEEATVIRQT